MDNRDATIVLNLLPGIGPIRLNLLLSVLGEAAAVLSASVAKLARIPGIGGNLAEVIHGWRERCDLQGEKEMSRRAGVTILTRDDRAYPELLREIHDPPICLYVRGQVDALGGSPCCISMVGSRWTTSYGVRMAEHLATAASLAGWTVVSGLARGIDTASHTAVVRSGGCTVAILGSGLGRLYPQANLQLAHDICGAGALVSEFPMMFPPDKRTFPMRNRLIAGMSRGTIVIQAGHRSGSLITAGQALEQGRLVFAVPGRVDEPQSRGCHALIRDGARLVENFGDVLEEFSLLPGFPRQSAVGQSPTREAAGRPEQGREDLQLSDLERKIVDLLENEEVSVDMLVAGTQEPASRVLGALVILEMRRIIRQLPGRRVALWGHTAVTG